MRKTRVIDADFGKYPNRIIPYSGYTFGSRRDRLATAVSASGLSWDDFILKQWTEGHSVYGLNHTLDKTGYGSNIGTQDFYSTERKRPRFNNCSNSKSTGRIHTFTIAGLQKETAWNHNYDQFWCPCRMVYDVAGNTLDPIDKHFSVDWSNAQRTAWWEMQPRFEGNISMFNFLLELKDVKELLKLLRAHPIRKLRNFFRRKRKLFDPSKPLAEAHLMNEFAIKPLLSDILTITCQIEEHVRNAQEEFAEAGLGRNSRHWSDWTIVDDSNLVYGGYYYYYQASGEVEWQKFTATMEYNYNYSARSSLDAFMRFWGLTPTWEAIWNAIPFSFVVDYFVKVGNSIAAMETDPNVEVLLNQYCESILSMRSSGTHIVTDNCYEKTIVVDGDLIKNGLPLVSGNYSSLYTRRVVAPNKGAALPSVGPMSSKQGLNLAALLRCFF